MAPFQRQLAVARVGQRLPLELTVSLLENGSIGWQSLLTTRQLPGLTLFALRKMFLALLQRHCPRSAFHRDNLDNLRETPLGLELHKHKT